MDRPPDRSARSATAILVAAHNEAERIAATLAALGSAFPEAAVWVADDGSSDATAEIARRAGAKVVRSEHAIGKGAAVTLAAREALAETRGPGGAPRVFLLCDGDLAESAAELARIVEVVRTGKADLAVATFATRIGGGLGLARGFARRAIRWRCGLATAAPISGQRALTEATLCEVLPFASGYGMEIGMTIDAVRAGRRLVEVELDLSHRASRRTPGGFIHRGRQLVDFARVYLARG